MPASDGGNVEPPVFLRWQGRAQGELHIFVRSDWVMSFLFDHLPHEDAVRTWTKMHAERIQADQGKEAAEEFLDTFGVGRHCAPLTECRASRVAVGTSIAPSRPTTCPMGRLCSSSSAGAAEACCASE